MVVWCAFSLPWRAYAIRPYTCSVISWVIWWSFDVQLPYHGGRMRYAPTHVRLFHGWHGGRLMCFFPAMEGVCDTPLHMFDHFTGNAMVVWCAFSLLWRAYAIRPYTCSFISWVMRWLFDVQLRRHGGRMRYAPTDLPLIWWTHDGQTNRFDADMNMTKPPNESRRW